MFQGRRNPALFVAIKGRLVYNSKIIREQRESIIREARNYGV